MPRYKCFRVTTNTGNCGRGVSFFVELEQYQLLKVLQYNIHLCIIEYILLRPPSAGTQLLLLQAPQCACIYRYW